MELVEKTIDLGTTSLKLSTGKLAKQASGSAFITAGGTAVLVTAQAAKDPRSGVDFLPLTVDYQEKMSAAGRIPGGFFKREGRPRDDETLTSRLIDRSIRPLIVEGWRFETQVIATVFSMDPAYPADTLALSGASFALALSDVPFQGPIAGVRVCRVDRRLLVNPSHEQRELADINLFVSCSRDAIVMVEGGANIAKEADVIDALLFAHEQAQKIISAQEDMVKLAGKTKREFTPPERDKALEARVRELATPKLSAAYEIREKQERYAKLDEV
ncbi:MAG: polyribonucleotide nucleotidyltransferase, partial [Deltaproteobacteria bacterium]|nr:polyribonucleotide nucleotidyltransferase [Deltaproteobacteria bacterium]